VSSIKGTEGNISASSQDGDGATSTTWRWQLWI